MKKKEILWREILYQVLEKERRQFTQKELALKFGFSLSTVFNALKVPRQIKAIEVSGRNFRALNPEKLLYLWGTFRNLDKDIIYETSVPSSSSLEIEGLMPNEVIYGAYSAYRKKFEEAPADYDKVYVYIPPQFLKKIEKRFPPKRGYSNLIVLEADEFLKDYGSFTPIAQTFVDLWNLREWYARDFYLSLKEKIDGILA